MDRTREPRSHPENMDGAPGPRMAMTSTELLQEIKVKQRQQPNPSTFKNNLQMVYMLTVSLQLLAKSNITIFFYQQNRSIGYGCINSLTVIKRKSWLDTKFTSPSGFCF